MLLALPVLNGLECSDVLPTKLDRKEYRNRLLAVDPRCLYCGKALRRGRATLDHLVPLVRGGRHTRDNLVLSCRSCNEAKRDRTLDEWLQDLRRAWVALQSVPRCPVQGSVPHVSL